MKRDANYKYFVYKFPSEGFREIYRVYSAYRYYEPKEGDPRCAWRGNDYNVALVEAKKANARVSDKSVLVTCGHDAENCNSYPATGDVYCFKCNPPRRVT